MPIVRYFLGFEMLSLDVLLNTASIDATNLVLEVGDKFVIALDSVTPTSR